MRSFKYALITSMIMAMATPVASQTVNLDRLLNAKAGVDYSKISRVRRASLDEVAITLGTQTGMIERAKEIGSVIETRRALLDKTFRFGDLVIGQGVLPPVIVKTDNAVSVSDNSMRLAGTVYRLVQPARFFSGAPSWRDWLLMGLPLGKDVPTPSLDEQLLPRNAEERAYWKKRVEIAYEIGRRQADEIFRNNLARLEETYNGMRIFFDLYQRKMVSAPYIASSQEIVTQDDPNTMIVGDTTFRITIPSSLDPTVANWKALQATPKADKPLPVVKSTKLERAKEDAKKKAQAKAQSETARTAPVQTSEPTAKVESLTTQPSTTPAPKAVVPVKDEAKKPIKTVAKVESRPVVKATPKPDPKPDPKPEAKPEAKKEPVKVDEIKPQPTSADSSLTESATPVSPVDKEPTPASQPAPDPVQPVAATATVPQPVPFNPPPLFN